MKRVLLTLQILASCSLVAATNCPEKPGCCKKDCAPKQCAKECAKECAPKAPCKQACPAEPVLNGAYNYPALTKINCSWHVNVDAGFIYWQPMQENMELGVVLAPSTLDPI